MKVSCIKLSPICPSRLCSWSARDDATQWFKTIGQHIIEASGGPAVILLYVIKVREASLAKSILSTSRFTLKCPIIYPSIYFPFICLLIIFTTPIISIHSQSYFVICVKHMYFGSNLYKYIFVLN